MESLLEIRQFLTEETRFDVKEAVVAYLLGLTASKDFLDTLYKVPEILTDLGNLINDKNDAPVRRNSLLCLVNVSSDIEGAKILRERIPQVNIRCVRNILDENNNLADMWAMLLSNLSRPESLVEAVYSDVKEHINQLFDAFTRLDYNKAKCNLNHLASIFSNLSQITDARAYFSESDRLNSILPYISCPDNEIRKRGAVSILRNVCFDSSQHKRLLEESEILPKILLPLAGPEEFDDEENEKLPIELQFLEPGKEREEFPDIRKLLLETLGQLCATRHGREYLRSNGTYEILRELHKWENSLVGDKICLLACENVVDILIRTEDEIGEDNLKTLDIPDDLVEKFDNLTD